MAALFYGKRENSRKTAADNRGRSWLSGLPEGFFLIDYHLEQGPPTLAGRSLFYSGSDIA